MSDSTDAKKSAEEIRQWMIAKLSSGLDVEENEIDVNLPFVEFGIESSA